MSKVTIHRVPREHVYRIWPLLYRGIAECIEDTERTHEEVFADLASNEGEELFVIMLDAKKFLGFVTLRIFNFKSEVWGTIGLLYIEPFRLEVEEYLEKDASVLEEGLELLEKYLVGRGCTHMNYVTPRKAFQRWAPRLGFRSRLVEWVKEV